MVSLTYLDRPVYGLPHMHQRKPDQARFVGHLSAERDPVAYRGAVQELLSWHAAHHTSVPLVINTCGWIKVRTLVCFNLPVQALETMRPFQVGFLRTIFTRDTTPLRERLKERSRGPIEEAWWPV